jgi:hypothetical protein
MEELSSNIGDRWQNAALCFRFSNGGPMGKVGERKGGFLKNVHKLLAGRLNLSACAEDNEMKIWTTLV